MSGGILKDELNKFQKLSICWNRIPKPLSGNKKGYKKGYEDGFLAAYHMDFSNEEIIQVKTLTADDQIENLQSKGRPSGYSGSWVKRLYRMRDQYKMMNEIEADPKILKGFKMALSIFEGES